MNRIGEGRFPGSFRWMALFSGVDGMTPPSPLLAYEWAWLESGVEAAGGGGEGAAGGGGVGGEGEAAGEAGGTRQGDR